MNCYSIYQNSTHIFTAQAENEKEFKKQYVSLLEKHNSKLSVAGMKVKIISNH